MCSFFCTRPFDQELWSSLIYFFDLHKTIRPRIMALIDLFLSFPINHSTKIYGLHSFISFIYTRPFDQNIWPTFIFLLLCTTIRPKMKVLIDLFLLFAHDHSTKLYGPLSYILLLCTTIRRKIRVLINLFLLFTHDHSTNTYGRLSFILSFENDHSTKIYGPLSFIISLVDDYSTKN